MLTNMQAALGHQMSIILTKYSFRLFIPGIMCSQFSLRMKALNPAFTTKQIGKVCSSGLLRNNY